VVAPEKCTRAWSVAVTLITPDWGAAHNATPGISSLAMCFALSPWPVPLEVHESTDAACNAKRDETIQGRTVIFCKEPDHLLTKPLTQIGHSQETHAAPNQQQRYEFFSWTMHYSSSSQNCREWKRRWQHSADGDNQNHAFPLKPSVDLFCALLSKFFFKSLLAALFRNAVCKIPADNFP
jgi:hypothetical protein